MGQLLGSASDSGARPVSIGRADSPSRADGRPVEPPIPVPALAAPRYQPTLNDAPLCQHDAGPASPGEQRLTGPLNRRLQAIRHRLPARLRPWLPEIPPPTPRNLWLLLALLVATQNCVAFQATFGDQGAVQALVFWGGALICMEDQLEQLRPSPGLAGLLLGSLLLLLVLARTAVIVEPDAVLWLLPPLAGVALALLIQPLRRLWCLRDSYLCLLLFPASLIPAAVLPDRGVSVITAHVSAFWLSILGLEPQVRGRSLMLPGGGVQISGMCNGIELITQLLAVAIIFLLAFPLRSRTRRLALLLVAPFIGFLANSIRIALLAVFSSLGRDTSDSLFIFFHDDYGSLLFAGLAVSVYGSLYLRLLESELGPELPETEAAETVAAETVAAEPEAAMAESAMTEAAMAAGDGP